MLLLCNKRDCKKYDQKLDDLNSMKKYYHLHYLKIVQKALDYYQFSITADINKYVKQNYIQTRD
jgi:hypothetical protein